MSTREGHGATPVNPNEAASGRPNFEPGWRWFECVKPVAQTDLRQLSHVGHAASGRTRVRMSDGTEKTISAGQSYTIPPVHDACGH